MVWFRKNPITIFKEEVAALGTYLQEEVVKLQGGQVVLVRASQEGAVEDEVERMVADACGSLDAGQVEENEVHGYFACPPSDCPPGRHLHWWKRI